jgi:radical SAM/Cys-rich protein
MVAGTYVWEEKNITKVKINTIQINIGNRCNQACAHCHIGASPRGNKNMDYDTARKILDKLLTLDIKNIEFTGGTPELNPHLKMFIEELSQNGKKISVRTSLTVLDLPEYASFIDFYRKHGVNIIASLPSVFEDLTDKQRGSGVFRTSIKVLKKLTESGYGSGTLKLDLVYNPVEDHLPPEQSQLEREYKALLKDMYDITFNNLITIVNSPIKRFKNHLEKQNRLDHYMRLLVNNFNPETIGKIMCRNLISVDYQGYMYDCDFNLALGLRIKGYENKKFWEIDFDHFNPNIACDAHCYACTVNMGSSCHGALLKDGPDFDVIDSVTQYYGEELKGTSDLKTSACCTLDTIPEHVKSALPYIADEIKAKYYGCGSPIPMFLDNLKILDIGCGTGRDTYIMSKLVGKDGFVYGIDMTESQIEVATRYIQEQSKRFGYTKPNIDFIQDYIENVGNHFTEESLDMVISNCVINLVEDKEHVIGEIHRMLKFGGEFYFSDIYADRRIPDDLRRNHVLYGECLGGALYYKDFERVATKAGFIDPRVVSKRTVDITNKEIMSLVGNITFYSITYRLWKLAGMEDACEDYGHIAVYKGGIPETPFKFQLDSSHVFEKNKPEKVCGNTALMLSETRFKDYFQVTGSFEEHFGEFRDCGKTSESDTKNGTSGTCGCS